MKFQISRNFAPAVIAGISLLTGCEKHGDQTKSSTPTDARVSSPSEQVTVQRSPSPVQAKRRAGTVVEVAAQNHEQSTSTTDMSAAPTTAAISVTSATEGTAITTQTATEWALTPPAIEASQSVLKLADSSLLDAAALDHPDKSSVQEVISAIRPRIQQIKAQMPALDIKGDLKEMLQGDLDDLDALTSQSATVSREEAAIRLKGQLKDISRIMNERLSLAGAK